MTIRAGKYWKAVYYDQYKDWDVIGPIHTNSQDLILGNPEESYSLLESGVTEDEAKLIAAAPRLLKAFRYITDALGGNQHLDLEQHLQAIKESETLIEELKDIKDEDT